MGTFVTQTTTPTLYDHAGDKSDARTIPAGADAANFHVAAEINRERDALLDLRTEARGREANIKHYGTATGDGSDATAAIQAALDDATATRVYVPEGTFGVKANSGAALTLSRSGVTFYGPGIIKPIANASGYAPSQTLLVSGSRNQVEVRIWNSGDLATQASDGSNEYPMEGIRVTGSHNTIRFSEVWNFVTPIDIRGGSGNDVLFNRVSVKDKDNLAWPNDGILFFQTTQGRAIGNQVGFCTSAATAGVAFESVTGASTSTLRTGITADASTEAIIIAHNVVGEGFVAGIHHEGTGDRQNLVTDNIVYKQKRNGINAAGDKLIVRGNWCLGTFNTDTTVNLTGIIGSVEANTVVEGNYLVCDSSSVEGVRILSNSENVIVRNNVFSGTFQHCVEGAANNVQVVGNILTGTAARFAYLEKPSAITSTVNCRISENHADGCTTQFAFLGSGLTGEVAGNKIVMLEGYVAADGVIEFGGSYLNVPTHASLRIRDNECVYTGTTSISGSFDFIKSSATNGSNLRGYVRDNSFDTTIWSTAIGGTFVSGNRMLLSGNSSDGGDAGARSGSFTLSGASSTTQVANNAVSAASSVILTPLNAAAATLQGGAQAVYVSGRAAGIRFEVRTADNTVAAGTEQFLYVVVD